MPHNKSRPVCSVIRAPRHTVKEFYEALGNMLDRYKDISEATILEAAVDTDPKSIYDGAVDLTLYRPDLGETGVLTIPVMHPDNVIS